MTLTTVGSYIPGNYCRFRLRKPASGPTIGHFSRLRQRLLLCGLLPFAFLVPRLAPSLEDECLVSCNASDQHSMIPPGTFFSELQQVAEPSKIHPPQGETSTHTHVRSCDATENEGGFGKYSTIQPSPRFVDQWRTSRYQPAPVVYIPTH
jgi:hypothetical protein